MFDATHIVLYTFFAIAAALFYAWGFNHGEKREKENRNAHVCPETSDDRSQIVDTARELLTAALGRDVTLYQTKELARSARTVIGLLLPSDGGIED